MELEFLWFRPALYPAVSVSRITHFFDLGALWRDAIAHLLGGSALHLRVAFVFSRMF